MTGLTTSPRLVHYLPFIYVVWADGLLTESELDVIRNIVKTDASLDGAERASLLKYLDTAFTPDPDKFRDWKELRQNENLTIDFKNDIPLTDYAIRLGRNVHTSFSGNPYSVSHREY